MSEAFSDRAEFLFEQALQDAAMSAPGGATPLFDPAVFDIRLGGDTAINAGGQTLTLPLQKVIVTIGQPYGTEQGYMSPEPDVDCEIWMPFKVWGNSGSDAQDFDKRVDFFMDYRKSVFSLHGLTLLGGVVRRRPIVYDKDRGLIAREYALRFLWTRD